MYTNPSEDVLTVVIKANSNSHEETRALQPGKIIGVKAFTNGADAGILVRAEIQDMTGNALSRFQPLDNYKQRQGGDYFSSAKPFHAEGGQSYRVIMRSKANLADDLEVDFVFIYQSA